MLIARPLLLPGIEAVKQMRKGAHSNRRQHASKRDVFAKRDQMGLIVDVADLRTLAQYKQAIIDMVERIKPLNREYSFPALRTDNKSCMWRNSA